MSGSVFTAFFPFGGAGGGALGFAQAEIAALGRAARFRVIGGFDFDAEACADFEYLTGAREACADVMSLTPAKLRAIAGERAPDVVFSSAPCKGASGLLSDAKSKTPKYAAMNDLSLVWIRLMLETWGDAPPKLVLFENVPRLKTRAGGMLREIRRLLRAAGYVISDGFHDCGELGGLAQHRRRYLMVARHKSLPPLLYQPPKRRVRACGEVIGPLPMPEDPAGGPMHMLPKISWLNWVRLALIPAGGDWRDLPGVLAEGEERRAKFKRHAVEDFAAPVGTERRRANAASGKCVHCGRTPREGKKTCRRCSDLGRKAARRYYGRTVDRWRDEMPIGLYFLCLVCEAPTDGDRCLACARMKSMLIDEQLSSVRDFEAGARLALERGGLRFAVGEAVGELSAVRGLTEAGDDPATNSFWYREARRMEMGL